MATFDEFWSTLEKELIKFAEANWKLYRDAALADGKAFLEKAKVDLERWTKMITNDGLTRNDFDWLVRGKKDLAELVALKRKGLTKVALDNFTSGLIDTVVTTAFKVF